MRFLLGKLLVIGCLLSPAAAGDFDSLLDDLSFAPPSIPSYARQTTPAPAPAELPPAANHGFKLPENSPAAPLQAQARLLKPVIAAQPADKLTDADDALSAMSANSKLVESSSVGHLFGLGKKHASACDSCDSCDAVVPEPPKALKPPKAPCESCVVLPPDSNCGRSCRHEAIFAKHKTPEFCPSREPVSLPSSTLLQFFSSNRCNTHVWDGYSQKCKSHHKPSSEPCDCTNSRPRKHCLGGQCGEILDPACPTGNCDECAGVGSIWGH